ncbi:uncharacterized protein N7503_003069 [Penicillium pulvis]|uniref:uncharacterized protein n=1 Tax=Penicillium pulvis TaxID=1562058 RepID=UPI00254695FB|nr:uncharacterized protein N7503_003069 [Penicillium pulvis]KAJ5805467.1 hypothetical protein N7503_003069 [Penicillium pulvis]
MSNLMHKMKDALTGHHDSENKGSSHDSSHVTQKVDDARDTYGQGDTWGSSTNAQDPTTTGDYSSKPMGSDSYGTSGYDTGAQRGTKMPGVMEETGNTYGSTNTGSGNYGSTGMGMGTQDSTANRMQDTGDTYGSSNMGNMGTDTYDSANKAKDYDTGYQKPIGSETYGSNTRAGDLGSGMNTDSYGSATQDYGSNPMNTGIGESQMSNKMDSGFDNRATTGTGQTGAYNSNYGDDLGGSNRYNTRSSTAANMPSQMETRSESEMDKQGFGGGAAGGSSYNTADAPKRRSSGPHSSNLLNKLDPRVRSSDYEGNATGNQRGN